MMISINTKAFTALASGAKSGKNVCHITVSIQTRFPLLEEEEKSFLFEDTSLNSKH